MTERPRRPDILFLMCDQFRYDCIRSLGNPVVRTPNLDRLVKRGATFTRAYSNCPVCVPARYAIRTGREPATVGCFTNEAPVPSDGQDPAIETRCGPYLARVLSRHGYRTFGIGKSHTLPDMFEDIGFETHLHTEELWDTKDQRDRDAYLRFLRTDHPGFGHIEQPHGERSNMYYVPQTSPLPAELTVEGFVADQAVRRVQADDPRPYFGFVSFIGPHPPFAPPIPYNRMYDPDDMPGPNLGDIAADHLDEFIPFMNHLTWAEDIGASGIRNLWSRYLGEITYIDDCIGRILEAVEASGRSDDTLIAFFSDHGELLGDHHGWQKQCFFEASCRIPFLVSWPAVLGEGVVSDSLVSLTDLFGLATSAAGCRDLRDGIDILRLLQEGSGGRASLAAVMDRPGTDQFKAMWLEDDWKYVFLANGGREMLFDLRTDPFERRNRIQEERERGTRLRARLAAYCGRDGLRAACEAGDLRPFPFRVLPRLRLLQFDRALGVDRFTEPSDRG